MSVKKIKGKGKSKGTAKKSAKKSSRTKKTKDVVQVRENINDLVKDSAEDIATEVIKVAKTGQLASAKYLFEAVGLYPATEETKANPQGDSLAHTLLRRMGLPTEPVICDEEPEPALLARDANGVGNKICAPNQSNEAREENGEADLEPAPAEGDE